MAQHRHSVIYSASDEGSRIKLFELFRGENEYGRVHHVSQVGPNAYECIFFSQWNADEVWEDLQQLGISVLQQKIDGHLERQKKDISSKIFPECRQRIVFLQHN